ncbi:hypothetical protein LRS11_01915 [Pseudomonas sp. J452]|uniref:substrate-binding periplasmic protein n=1 Tax=Pseudomonas sp. J452 TaxID=2898441 RepID=UPI0021AD506E|nr:transporter substrate-binding domain-containing protein [Pseudomonas sp. J452]UUY08825.1 hypothetical protein LRS11_01915 [Pseudomonas sp. J452]
MRALILGVVVGLGSCFQAQACEISLTYSIDPIPPLIMGDSEIVPEQPGLAIELVQRAADDIGCQLHLKRAPTLRVLASVESGRQDGALLYSYNAERATRFAYPLKDGVADSARSVSSQAYVLFRLRGSALEWDGQRFSGLDMPLGVNRGWSIVKDLQAHGVTFEEEPSARRNLAKLRAGRLAGYVTLREAGSEAIRQHGFEDIEQLAQPFVIKDYFVIFNRDFQARNPQLLERLWLRIAQLRDEVMGEQAAKYQILDH